MDVGGVGAGVVDILHDSGYDDLVVPVNFGGRPLDVDLYVNKRAEMWKTMGEWFESEGGTDIPDSDSLHADLISPTYTHNLVRNPRMNPPTIEGLAWHWRNPYKDLYVPLTYTVWTGLAKVAHVQDEHGPSLNPYIFHTANLAIHLASAAFAFALLMGPIRTPTLIVVAMVIIGYASGTKLQICGYLTTRYGGMRNFGKIFGTMASIIALGSGLGPVLGGLVYDMYGSYTPFLLAGIAGSLLSGFLIFGLGRYPVWEQQAETVAPVASARRARGAARV